MNPNIVNWIKYLMLIPKAILESLSGVIEELMHPKHKYAKGNSRFMNAFEKLREFSPRNQGVVLGSGVQLSMKRSYQGTCIVAPVGFGKSTGVIVPSILMHDAGSLIVTDPSGEVYQVTAGHLRDKGYEIQVLNTSEIDRSFSYNPLANLTTAKRAKQVSHILIKSAYPQDNGKNTFWNAGASSIVYVLIRALMAQPEEYRNLYNLKYLLDSFGSNDDLISDLVIELGDDQVLTELKGFLAQDEKVRQGMISTGKVALEKFSDPSLCKLCSGMERSIDIASIRTKKTALFIQSREDQISYYSFIYRLLYTEIFEMLMESPEKEGLPVTLLLDEFANLGRLPNFSTYATTLRKRRASLVVVLQELSQLEAVYGEKDAATILNGGLTNKAFYPGLGLKTTEKVSKMLGNTVVHIRENERVSSIARPLMTPEEIRTMRLNDAILIGKNFHPLRYRITPFYMSRYLKRLSEIPAPIIASNLSNYQLKFLKAKPKAVDLEPDHPSIPDIDLFDSDHLMSA